MKSSIFRWMRRLALGVAVILVTVLVAGFIYEVRAGLVASREFPPPGEMVDVGGHKLHWYCTGEGSPAVVLDAGAGPWGSLSWRPVQSELARTTRVCSYDRAGILWSERGPRPRSGGQMISELGALLDRTGTTGPIVLAGHSVGGQLAVQFALAHPDRVAGLVLVDASHPATLDHLPDAIRGAFVPPAVVRSVARATSRIGLQRLLGGNVPLPRGVSVTEREALAAFLPRSTRTNMDEIEQIVLADEFSPEPGSLGNRPISILSAGRFGPGEPPNWRPEWSREYMRVWGEMQDSLAALSTNSRHEVVEDSDHFVHWSDPNRVIEAIRTMVCAARMIPPAPLSCQSIGEVST